MTAAGQGDVAHEQRTMGESGMAALGTKTDGPLSGTETSLLSLSRSW